MSTLEELDDLDRREKDKKKAEEKDIGGNSGNEVAMKDEDDILDDEIRSLNTQDLQTRKRLLENDSRIMKSELSRLSHEKAAMGEKIKDNVDKIANNRYTDRDSTRRSCVRWLRKEQAATLSRWKCCRTS